MSLLNNGHHKRIIVIVSICLLLILILISSVMGTADISVKDILGIVGGHNFDSRQKMILMQIRLPRILTSVMVGGLLAVVGALMQGVFKNKMADPSVMGISGGAALGAAVIIVLNLDYGIIVSGLSTRSIGAIIGSIMTYIGVMTISEHMKMRGNDSVSSTLLVGVAISSLTGALLSILMALHLENMERVYLWTMGSFSGANSSRTITLFVLCIIVLPIIYIFAPEIDVLKLGSATAQTFGINPNKLMRTTLTLTSVIVAFCVTDCGIIGFVGLVIPHVVTFLGFKQMRSKVVMCFIMGGIFTLAADTVARTVIAPSELPVGAITGLIGAPYFLFLLIKRGEARDK